jgi:cytochrome b subunit of formate dehydrogenase
MKKIPHKFRMIVFVFFMTVFIGLALSGLLLFREQGFVDGFLSIWMNRFVTMWLTVVPVVVVVIPLVNFMTNKVVETK